MATTVTWGSGGTYATLKAAWDAVTWNDDHIFDQVGTSTESSQITYRDRGGYSATIRGNGDLVTMSYGSTGEHTIKITPTALSGDITFEYLNISITGSLGGFLKVTSTSSTSYKVVVRYNKAVKNGTVSFSGDVTVGIMTFLQNSSSNTQEVYGNDFDCTLATPSGGVQASVIAALEPTPTYVEDNLLTGANAAFTDFAALRVALAHIRRNYLKNFQNDHAFFLPGTLGVPSSGRDDTYCDHASDAYITDVTHLGLAFDTTNFLSITPGESDYGIPKPGSPTYDDALQTTNIPENLVGLNGLTVDYRAAGPYTPDKIITPPTNLAYELLSNGVKLTWTPASPAEPGYEDVDVFWELIASASSFDTPKAHVNKGSTEYVIPYSSLTDSPIWYAGLKHAAE